LKAALIETRAKLSGAEALIEHLQLVIAKMKREIFGPRSERSQRLIDQLELQLEELAAAAGEDETKARVYSVIFDTGFESCRPMSPLQKKRATKLPSAGLPAKNTLRCAPLPSGWQAVRFRTEIVWKLVVVRAQALWRVELERTSLLLTV
jgi:hypothetical protein